ncbi:Mov34/MPN/PAD-1 family protein [Hylemonella sp. W303a]|uniref:Mov34/MPN/PAD-1 family protein n=1 Tax=Hylemonella sp. W303a TaxID=3389873 RepID=UPI00396B44D1
MRSMRSALVWKHQRGKGVVLIEAEALVLMDNFRQNTAEKPESGGILLGYRRGPHLHVTAATAPQAADRSSRYLFQRSSSHHQEIAIQQWNASGGTMDYLGEWHTHPQQKPSPSTIDLNEWIKLSGKKNFPLVFVIMGWTGDIWVGFSDDRKIHPCNLIYS